MAHGRLRKLLIWIASLLLAYLIYLILETGLKTLLNLSLLSPPSI